MATAPTAAETLIFEETSQPLYRFLLFLCFWTLGKAGLGQALSPFTFTRYTMSTGLLSNEILSVAQDRTGYLWIASNNGLQRFDGVHYKTFQHQEKDPHSLPGNSLIQLLIDNNDNLWILFADGKLGLFDKQNFTFTPIPVKLQRPVSLWSSKRLIKDEKGTIFFPDGRR